MTSQWPDNCDAITWKVISNSLDIDFIHGDIHGRSCKNLSYFIVRSTMKSLDSSEQELLDILSKVGTPGLASGVPTDILKMSTRSPRIRSTYTYTRGGYAHPKDQGTTHILLGSITWVLSVLGSAVLTHMLGVGTLSPRIRVLVYPYERLSKLDYKPDGNNCVVHQMKG